MAPGPLAHAVGTFGEDLVGMLWGAPHHVKDLEDVLVGHEVAEEIAHTIDEDHPR